MASKKVKYVFHSEMTFFLPRRPRGRLEMGSGERSRPPGFELKLRTSASSSVHAAPLVMEHKHVLVQKGVSQIVSNVQRAAKRDLHRRL